MDHEGTRVAGARIRAAYVPPGGEVHLGSTVLQVHQGPESFVVFPEDGGASFHGMVSGHPGMRDLFALVGQLARADLFYRLAGVTLEIPPLRDRLEDLPRLLEAFLADCAGRHQLPAPEVTAEALEALAKHAWPGNLRELRNVVDALCVLSQGRAGGAAEVARVVRAAPAPDED